MKFKEDIQAAFYKAHVICSWNLKNVQALVQNGIYLDAAKLKNISLGWFFCFCAAEHSNYCDSSNNYKQQKF